MRKIRTCLLTIACLGLLLCVPSLMNPVSNHARAAGEPPGGSASAKGTVVKKVPDHKEIKTDSCGLLREVLAIEDKLPLTLVIADDIQPTKGHFHRGFKEIYFVLDGTLSLKFYDPATDRYWEETLAANELCIIDANIHHVVTRSSPKNRLCVIAVPGYTDETLSDKF